MPDTHDAHEEQPEAVSVPRRLPPDEVLRARPIKGPIDWAALSREHIARFPKIIAALAKYERNAQSR